MEEKDRWSVHVEYLKIAIALATALIAAAAAIYVDVSKIPVDQSRYFLLAGVAVFFVTLISSVWSIASLSNHFIHAAREGPAVLSPTSAVDGPNIPTPAAQGGTPKQSSSGRNLRARRAVWWANISFFSLAVGAGLLALFFALRTINSGGMLFERAIGISEAASRKLIDSAKETISLKSIEHQGGDTYRLIFQVSPGPGNITVVTDPLGANLKSATRQ
jgi:hypothetical protein